MSVHTARKLRKKLTDVETRLWSRLRRKQLNGYRFRRQAPIRRYVVDFACFEAKLIVEVDGGQHAESKSDAMRTAFLEQEGFRVLRFWNNDVLQNIDGVIEKICTALAPLPSPPPQGGRG